MIPHDLTPTRPDYAGGSIVNLMSSLGHHLGGPTHGYAPLRALPEARLAGARRVALIVIDGLGAELLAYLDHAQRLAPYRAATMTSVFPPTTASAVTTFMSGLAPQQHGLTGWFMHFRRLGAVTAVLPFVPRYARQGLREVGIEPAALIDAPSFTAGLRVPAALLMPADLVDSGFSRLLGAGARRDAYRDLDGFRAALTAFVAGRDEARYLYAYWPELDRLAHLHGPSAAAVAAHFDALAAALAPVLAAARDSGTLVILTADHGFIDSGPAERIELAAHPRLGALLALPLCGEPRTAYAYVRAAAADEFAACAGEAFGPQVTVHRADDFLAAGWFGPGEPHPELAARIGDFVLSLAGRATLRDLVVGERPFDLYGQHGGVSAAEQLVPLLLAGP